MFPVDNSALSRQLTNVAQEQFNLVARLAQTERQVIAEMERDVGGRIVHLTNRKAAYNKHLSDFERLQVQNGTYHALPIVPATVNVPAAHGPAAVATAGGAVPPAVTRIPAVAGNVVGTGRTVGGGRPAAPAVDPRAHGIPRVSVPSAAVPAPATATAHAVAKAPAVATAPATVRSLAQAPVGTTAPATDLARATATALGAATAPTTTGTAPRTATAPTTGHVAAGHTPAAVPPVVPRIRIIPPVASPIAALGGSTMAAAATVAGGAGAPGGHPGAGGHPSVRRSGGRRPTTKPAIDGVKKVAHYLATDELAKINGKVNWVPFADKHSERNARAWASFYQSYRRYIEERARLIRSRK